MILVVLFKYFGLNLWVISLNKLQYKNIILSLNNIILTLEVYCLILIYNLYCSNLKKKLNFQV